MRGKKTGGRAAGTPNRKTAELVEKLEALNCDPVAALAKIAADPKTPLELRIDVNKALLPFIYPKRKAVEIENDGPPIVLRFGADDADL